MAFVKNQYQQVSINDTFLQLSQRIQKVIEKSWAQEFATVIMPAIEEKPFAALYSDNKATRPNTPVNMIIGSLILKELLNLTDDELLNSIYCDVRFQYALGVTSFEQIPFSDRTVSRFRERLYRYEQESGIDLLKDMIESMAQAFLDFFNIKPTMKRMDSLMISANCKKMTRLEILYTTVANLVNEMKEQEMKISEEMEHYLKEDDRNRVIYHEKNEGITERLDTILKDALKLREDLQDKMADAPEYQLLERVINEQTRKIGDKTELKDKKEIAPTSLQTPYDSEATYRSKAGKHNTGYVGNAMETFSDDKAIITSYDLQQNTYSDSQFCKDEITKMGEQEEPTTLITDGAYSSEENKELATKANIELVPTALIGKTPDEIIAEFSVDEEKNEVICPMGNISIKVSIYKAGMIRAIFEKSQCEKCPNKEKCGMTIQKKSAVITISKTAIARAAYLKKLGSEEYKELARKRNGVEALPSLLRRKYHVDKIQGKGVVRKKMHYGFKILAINVKRAMNYFKEMDQKEEIYA